MKVLFVGEGPTDIGSPKFVSPPRSATGVLFILSRKLCPAIGEDCLSIYWREITILNRQKKGNIHAARVAQAMALAAHHHCEGVVIVIDQERKDDDPLTELEKGIQRGWDALAVQLPAVCGVAVLTIEAWTLGSPSALTSVLKLKAEVIASEYKPHDVEEMNPKSGKPEKRSKELIAKIANLANREDNSSLREEVAEQASIDELLRHCSKGFKPFAEKLQAAFGPRPAS